MYILSFVHQSVMLINGAMSYQRLKISLRLENTLIHQNSRISIDTIHIGRIWLVIRTQNKAEVSKCSMYEAQKITAECKLWCQSIYLVYVVTRY